MKKTTKRNQFIKKLRTMKDPEIEALEKRLEKACTPKKGELFVDDVDTRFDKEFIPIMERGEELLAYSIDGEEARSFLHTEIQRAKKDLLKDVRERLPKDRTPSAGGGSIHTIPSENTGYNSGMQNVRTLLDTLEKEEHER